MKLRTIFNSLIIAIITACLGAVLLFELPTGWKALDIATGSMRPGLPPGTLVIVHSVPDSTLRVGDVITYKSQLEPGKLVTHRIIALKSIDNRIPAFIVKGDANPTADPEVAEGQVVGQVILHAPYVGRLFNYSHSAVGLGILVILPGFLIISYEIELLIRSLRFPDLSPTAQPDLRLPAEPKVPTRRRSLDGIAIRPLLILVLAVSTIGLSLGTTRANLTSNKVVLAANHLIVVNPLPSGSGCPTTVTITDTGPHSTNIVTCTNKTSTHTTNNNNVTIVNSSTQSATGGTASNSNTTNNSVSVANF